MFLNILIEVVLLAIVLGGAYYGYNKGLFKMTAGPVKLLLCLAVSFAFSRAVGGYIVFPIIISCIEEGISSFAYPVISVISIVSSFLILFLMSRGLLSIIISLINSLLDEGIIGKVNKAIGFILAGVIASLGAMLLASLMEYVLLHEAFNDSDLLKDFSGGPIYRLFTVISPVGLISTR